MARDYSRVAPAFWTGNTGRQLRGAGRDVQLLGLYLMTSPHANMIGLYQLALPTLCHEAGFTSEGASKALRSLSDAGFAYYDEEAEEVWVPAMAFFQVLDPGTDSLKVADKRCKGVERELRPFSKSKFFLPFVRRYGSAFHLPFEAPPEGPKSPSEGPSKTLRSQEQDQEQDQEQEAAAVRARRAGRKHKLGPEAAKIAIPPTVEAAPEPTQNPTADTGQTVAEKPGEPVPAAPASPGPRSPVEDESPGPEEDTGPAKSDAARVNAAGGMERPAALDSGEAAPARIAGEPRGARGPARRGPVEDELPLRQLPVWDASDGLGPLGSEFKARVELELHRGLAAPAAERRAAVTTELEQLLDDPRSGGVDRAVGWFAAVELAREGSGAPKTHSVTGALLVLKGMPPAEANPLARIRKSCPAWADMLEALQQMPPGDQLTPGVFETLFLPLVPTFLRGELVLAAPEAWQLSAIQDCYLGGLRKLATEVVGAHVVVNVVLAATAAAEA